MSRREFCLPDLGEGVTEGQVIRMLVAEGDHVTEDQPLMEVETDKASVEIPSPYTGVVSQVHVTEQQVINVGDVMVTFDEGEGEPSPVEVKTAHAAGAPTSSSAPPAATATATATGRTKPASPAVRKLARQRGVDLAAIEGSGPGGRVTREDVEIAASGPGPAAAAAPSGDAAPDRWGPTRREPLTRARKAIADAMLRSVSTVPHATDTDDADVTDLDRLRREPEQKLTILPFVIRATVLALQKHPIFNASYDAGHEQVVYHDYISIAIGVHTDRGLIAPVLRDLDRLTVPQIADELKVMAEKARTASFEVNDTRGGTFTITNAGAVGGSRYSTPIINSPQSAILALGRTRWLPWVVESPQREVVPRYIMPLSISFDHRLIDGAQEVHFMQAIIGGLEKPATLA